MLAVFAKETFLFLELLRQRDALCPLDGRFSVGSPYVALRRFGLKIDTIQGFSFTVSL